MLNVKRTTQDILQEEILRERAAVLARAGERLSEALAKLYQIEQEIERGIDEVDQGFVEHRQKKIQDINGKINHYNQVREYAHIRYYYLIVTREALGIRHHQRVEEIYRIPPRKKHFRER